MKLHRAAINGIVVTLVIFMTMACSMLQPQADRTLTVLAGSELSDLEPLLDEIENETGVRLQFEYVGTIEGAERLMAGEQVDLAWFSHAKYLNLMEGAQNVVLAQEKIMISPVVLGIKESLAEQWGWANNPDLTWRDVVERSAEGELNYAMTNPTSSNTGFSALVGVAAALLGSGDAIQEEDIAKISGDLRSFFKGQALTSGSSGWLADRYVEEQDRLDGMINYESVLLTLNKSGKLKEKLILLYPQEGIISADYPLLLINGEKREQYNQLVEYLRSKDFQQRMMEETLRRPVNISAGLSNDFTDQLLVELPFPSRLEVVDSLLFNYLDEQIKPSHTFYVLDVSGSMSGERLESLKQAMSGLTGMDTSLTGQFARFRNREKITIITFNQDVVERSYFEVNTEDPTSFSQIRSFVDGLNASGQTAIFSALNEAYRLAAAGYGQDPGRNFSIVLMSDGVNNAGVSEEEFLSFYRSDSAMGAIRTFTIAFGEADQDVMETIAEATGGRMFDAGDDPLALIFKEIRGYQ